MTESTQERILTGLQKIYKQNEQIIKLLEALSPAKISMLMAIVEERQKQNKEIESLAREFGGTVIE